MYINTLTISSKGQIVLPKKIRAILNSNLISLEVNEYNQVLIHPVHDVGGALSDYKQTTSLSFEKIREQAWNNSMSVTNSGLFL